MTPDEMLERLDGVRGREGAWTARCPAHDDRHSSLSVGVGQDGRVLLHCHAGCSTPDVLDALGVGPGALFNEGRDECGWANAVEIRGRRLRLNGYRARQAPPPPPRVVDPLPDEQTLSQWQAQLSTVAPFLWRTRGWTVPVLQRLGVGWDGRRVAIPVRDGEGRLQTVVHYRPGGRPKSLATRGRDRGLFPAPETLEGDLWLVEGEPDAIAGHELDLNAVAVPGVAKWSDGWLPRFAGRRVTVLMDCDVEGRAAAQRHAIEIAASGTEVRVIDLDPCRDDGFDLGDALVAARLTGRMGQLQGYLERLRREVWA